MTEPKTTIKFGKWIAQPGQPIQFTDQVEIATSEKRSSLSTAVALTIRAHHKAARELLAGKYASAASLAPPHFRCLCEILVLCCPDGVIVRYDRAANEQPKTRWTDFPESLADAAPKFSDYVVHFPKDAATYSPPALGPRIVLAKVDADGQEVSQAVLHPVIYASPTLPVEFNMPMPPARPPALAFVNREMQVQLVGQIIPINTPSKAVQPAADHFLAHGVASLPVGWEAVVVYPRLEEAYWKPEYAPIWAEQDLLAAIAQANADEVALHRLDGRVETRERLARTIEQFEGLLAGPEEPAHQFLKLHPELLCATHDAMWSKLRFGERISDFVFREPKDDYLLVEIEAPYRELFRQDGQQREELTHAINQTQDWIQYIQDNKRAVEQELGLINISATPRTLVVIGRNASLSEENHRKLAIIHGQNSRLQILTYDEVISRARANLERLFGPLSLQTKGLKVYYYREG